MQYSHFLPKARLSLLIIVLLLGTYSATYATQKTQVGISADHLESHEEDGEACQKLSDNVVFQFEDFTIHAESALYFEETKLIKAFGRVKIINKDGDTITADQLTYDDSQRIAKLRGQVVFNAKSEDANFYTDYFDYHVDTQQGEFKHGGKLVEGENTLTSDYGHYNGKTQRGTFYRDVTLTNKDYTLRCNKLGYDKVTKVAKFYGATTITSADGKSTLTTQKGGEYNTGSKQSTFRQSKVETEAYILYGDVLQADQEQEYYTAAGHVKLVAKEDNVIVTGDYGECHKKEGLYRVYGNPLLQKKLEKDTLYASADTFVALEDLEKSDNPNHVVKAYPNVKLYKTDFQGKADAMAYYSRESTLYFYNAPVFWNHANQLTADTAHIVIKDKTFHQMHLAPNAFVASKDFMGNYNQLKGSTMVAYFEQEQIDHILIDGNAESLYFVIDDDKKLQGMNHLKCSQMYINVEGDEIASIAPKIKPQGVFYPPHKIIDEDKILANFQWRGQERPTKQEVVGRGYGEQKGYEQFKFNK